MRWWVATVENNAVQYKAHECRPEMYIDCPPGQPCAIYDRHWCLAEATRDWLEAAEDIPNTWPQQEDAA